MLSNKSIQTFVCSGRKTSKLYPKSLQLCQPLPGSPQKNPPWHLVSHGKSPESQLLDTQQYRSEPWFFTGVRRSLIFGWVWMVGEYLAGVGSKKSSKNLWLQHTFPWPGAFWQRVGKRKRYHWYWIIVSIPKGIGLVYPPPLGLMIGILLYDCPSHISDELVGGWPTPLKNMTSSVGMMIIPYRKIYPLVI